MNDLYYLSFDEQNSGGKPQLRQQQLDKSNLTKYDADKKGRFLRTIHFIYILIMKTKLIIIGRTEYSNAHRNFDF